LPGDNGVFKWSYVRAILEEWRKAGRITKKQKSNGGYNGNGQYEYKPTHSFTPEQIAAAKRMHAEDLKHTANLFDAGPAKVS
jgi:hypothetical protein